MMKAKLYTDGGARGNPGPAGIGVVIKGSIPKEIDRYIGETTNNVAEYQALVTGLQESLSLGYQELEVFCDSELVIKQVKGIYKVKKPHLLPLCNQAKTLISKFEKVSLTHIPRRLNKEADALVNVAIDKEVVAK